MGKTIIVNGKTYKIDDSYLGLKTHLEFQAIISDQKSIDFLNSDKDLLIDLVETKFGDKDDVLRKWESVMRDVEKHFNLAVNYSWIDYKLYEEFKKMEEAQKTDWILLIFDIATPFVGSFLVKQLTKRIVDSKLLDSSKKIISDYKRMRDKNFFNSDSIFSYLYKKKEPYIALAKDIVIKTAKTELLRGSQSKDFQVKNFIEHFHTSQLKIITKLRLIVEDLYEEGEIDEVEMWDWFHEYNPKVLTKTFFKTKVNKAIERYQTQVLRIGYEGGRRWNYAWAAKDETEYKYAFSNICFLAYFNGLLYQWKIKFLVVFDDGDDKKNSNPMNAIVMGKYKQSHFDHFALIIGSDMEELALLKHKQVYGNQPYEISDDPTKKIPNYINTSIYLRKNISYKYNM